MMIWRMGHGLIGATCLAGSHMLFREEELRLLEKLGFSPNHKTEKPQMPVQLSEVPEKDNPLQRLRKSLPHIRFHDLSKVLAEEANGEQLDTSQIPKFNKEPLFSVKLEPSSVTSDKCAQELKSDHKNTKKEDKSSRKELKECVLVLGTTGSGKSSTIAKYTLQEVKVGDESDSVTRTCQVYPVMDNPDAPAWIDTVGYDDTTNLSDSESFKEVLTYMNKHDLLKIKAVIWTVTPQERKDARLQKQANFINQFKDQKIWNNVIIIVKQPGSFNVTKSSQGPLEAARAFDADVTKIQVLGYTYLDERIPGVEDFKKLDPEKLENTMHLLNDSQVRSRIDEALGKIGKSVQVIFEDHRCTACGAVGDKRLLPDFCHMEEVLVHPGTSEYFHPDQMEFYHPQKLDSRHTGVLQTVGGQNKDLQNVRNTLGALFVPLSFVDPTVGILTGVIAGGSHFLLTKMETPLQERYSCCKGEKGSSGCQVYYPCCQKDERREGCMSIFPCCKGGLHSNGCIKKYRCCDRSERSGGCQSVCKKCGQAWGAPAGTCYRPTNGQPHNLVRM